MSINLDKLKAFMEHLDSLCSSWTLFDDMCYELSLALGIPPDKLFQLTCCDVRDVFGDEEKSE